MAGIIQFTNLTQTKAPTGPKQDPVNPILYCRERGVTVIQRKEKTLKREGTVRVGRSSLL